MQTLMRLLFLGASFTLAGRAGAVVLYDGALATGPSSQGWLYASDPLIGALATQSVGGGLTTLDTTPVQSEMAGYFSTIHPDMPLLDRSEGYTIRLDARVVAESHASNDRAGLSLIVLASDQMGVELGFWENEIWAQADAPLFTHAEGAAFNTTASLVQYELEVLGGGYELSADGSPILSGSLRDYSSFGFPYNSSSFLFVGDDTSSAQAAVELARIEAVPEPATWLLALVGAGWLGGLARWRRRNLTAPR